MCFGNEMENHVDGYYTVSAGLIYSYNDNVKLNSGITNLFDRGPEDDYELAAYPSKYGLDKIHFRWFPN